MVTTLELIEMALWLNVARRIHEEGSEEACGLEYIRRFSPEEWAAMGLPVPPVRPEEH